MPDAELTGLTQSGSHELTVRANKFLLLAHESAKEALAAMKSLRAHRRAEQGSARMGRTSDQDQDLLRAMLVFACAGVDASMKALIREALPVLADMNTDVQAKLDTFAAGYLSDAGAVSPKALARVLGHAGSPRQALVEEFIEELTGGSLQSSQQLDLVCGALGIVDAQLRRDVDGLGPVFAVRNQIIHEMDLNPAPGGQMRRQRNIEQMVFMANRALGLAQRIVNSVTAALNAT
jgi:hypothetical protein